MFQSIGLILLSISYIFYVKRTKFKIRMLEIQRTEAFATCAEMIDCADNKLELLQRMADFIRIVRIGSRNIGYRKTLMEQSPESLSWADNVTKALVWTAILYRFENDPDNPLKDELDFKF